MASSSPVWKLMTRDKSKEEAKCNLCSSVFRHKRSGSTSNLLRHLQIQHPIQLHITQSNNKQPGKTNTDAKDELKRKDEGPSQSANDHAENIGELPSVQPLMTLKREITQPTLIRTIQKQEPYKPTSFRKKQLDDLVLSMITTDLQPLSVVENKGFRNLCHSLDPRYKIVSRKHLTHNLLPTKYGEEKAKLMIELGKVDHVSITTDQWTSRANDAYTTFTAHFIDEHWNLTSAVLSTRSDQKRHTAVNLSEETIKCLEEFKLLQKVSAVVTDNAKNVTNAVALSQADAAVDGHHPCFAHTLNLVVRHALEKDTATQRMIARVKNIVTFFHSSTQANNDLRKLQGEKFRKLKQDVVTRWNSTHAMLASYKEMHTDICTVLSQRGKSFMTLHENELTLLDTTIDVLGVFVDATEEMSAEKFTTISKIIPMIRQLKIKTEEGKTTLSKNLKVQLDSYFGSVEDDKILTLTTILDPRFKNKVFSTESVRLRVEEQLREEMSVMTIEAATETSNKKDEAAKPKKNKKTSLWDSFDQEIEDEKNAPATKTATMIEFENYILLERLQRKASSLEWWNHHEAQFPRLSKLAKKYLCIPATSVPSERVFFKSRRACVSQKSEFEA